ncbi:MAG: hypothetical protein HY904_04745 [Deltaproteobacteria bacterium]|nr:hypothetical protein [Deltaproteobacteria bacterium]
MAVPRLEAYIRALPQGLDSYPDHVVKASVVRSSLDAMPLLPHLSQLPAPLVELVMRPIPHSQWVPEVRSEALHEAMRELRFTDDESFLAAVAAGNRALLSGVLYGFLFRLIGVSRLLRGGVSRWEQMHRGTRFILQGDPESRGVVLRLGFPPHLYTPLSCRAYGEAFRVAMEVAGGAGARVVVTDYTPTFALYSAQW